MSPLDRMPTSQIKIVPASGGATHETKAIFTKNMVIIQDVMLTILVGDEIRRTLPNGQEEAFRVEDPVFYPKTFNLQPHYQVKVSRKGTFPPNAGGNYNITLSGSNARVNISSVDNSFNNVSNETLFQSISSRIDGLSVDDELRDQLKNLVVQMESKKGTPSFLQAYQKFVGLLGDHVTILAPLLPELTKFVVS